MTSQWAVIGGIAALLLVDMSSMPRAIAQFFDESATKSYRGIPYLSGGIGLDERESLRDLGRSHNLWLEFAQATGNYVSDVEISITNSKGEIILEAVSQGPWFFTTLPTGSYRVQARIAGRSLEKKAQVSAGKQTRVVFAAF